MTATIIMVSLAFLWLLIETDWLRVRLPICQNIDTLQSKSEGVEDDIKGLGFTTRRQHRDTDSPPFEPSSFIPLEMPATTGKLTILCERN